MSLTIKNYITVITASLIITDSQYYTKGKGKGRALDIAPQVDTSHHRGAQVHGVHEAASHVPALYLPSRSRYSLTDPERMEG